MSDIELQANNWAVANAGGTREEFVFAVKAYMAGAQGMADVIRAALPERADG